MVSFDFNFLFCKIDGNVDWYACHSAASGHLGQLVVWEWQSETFVLKQQGHEHAINSLDYAPDGALIITGGVTLHPTLSCDTVLIVLSSL